ncbi:FadR/GntR family transcriptional regulator [Roseovarius sp. 2305UL8-3]|uniref:FadR/GntR family transcriptional regulator n=1 Tax=Roseovarius conchicola TaxID=3121636 RepID=UPI003529A95C
MRLADRKWRYIVSQLKRSFTNGELALNDRLPPEREMSKTFGVSRGTIRKALIYLEERGLVEIRPNSGSYVIATIDGDDPSKTNIASPLELMEARYALEPYICMLAVLHGRYEDFEGISFLCEGMDNCGNDLRKFAELDIEFHQSIVKCTHNSLLIEMVEKIGDIRRTEEWMLTRLQILDAGKTKALNEHHRRILSAIMRRRADMAASAMRKHLEVARMLLIRSDECWEVLPIK